MTLPPRTCGLRRAATALVLLVGLTGGALSAPAGAAVADDPTTTTTTTAAPAPIPTTPPPPPPAPTRFELTGPNLKVGDRGAPVALLQMQLIKRGFWLAERLGTYGQSTKHAVTAFQKTYRLKRTGNVDGWTRAALAVSDERPRPSINKGRLAIEVDLTRQVLIVSSNGVTAVVLDISSGKRSTPTPRGSFKLQRQINGMRRSDLGTLWRPKYFVGGYALHGSPSVPAYAASHGCVRLTNQEIDFLWSSGLAPIGTPVVVY